MKRFLLPIILMISLSLLQTNLMAQTSPYNMIGKKMDTVIKTFGKPAFHDKSNPDLESVFYQSKDYRMAFIGDRDGVYQFERCSFFSSKNVVYKEFEKLLTKCKSEGFNVDSLDTYNYDLQNTGIDMNLSVYENSVMHKYELRIKANRKGS